MDSICLFHSRIYGKYQKKLFVFESGWDTFRPIERVGWNGSQYEIVDGEFKKDLFSKWYGFESAEQKLECQRLLNETELANAKEVVEPVDFWKWCSETQVKWWKDRPVVFTSSCVSRDSADWKKYLHYLNTKAKTLRQPFRGRLTRRLIHR